MTTIKAMKELARASKQINNNPNVRIQVAERKDETTIGFISDPLTYKEVED